MSPTMEKQENGEYFKQILFSIEKINHSTNFAFLNQENSHAKNAAKHCHFNGGSFETMGYKYEGC